MFLSSKISEKGKSGSIEIVETKKGLMFEVKGTRNGVTMNKLYKKSTTAKKKLESFLYG